MARPTPEQIANANTEHAHQAALFAWAAAIPELHWMYAVPNGGERHKAVAARMKAEGVRSGVWDVHLPLPRGTAPGLYIEMKDPKRRNQKQGGLSDDQVKFGMAMHAAGYATHVCYTWEEARDALLAYLALQTAESPH